MGITPAAHVHAAVYLVPGRRLRRFRGNSGTTSLESRIRMGYVPDPAQDLAEVFVKLPPWIDAQKDYEETKKKAIATSSTVSGIKGDITLLKAEFAGLAVLSIGLSAVKFDYTFFKMDEKGITINGRQRIGWPWADKAKHFALKAEKNNRALADQQKAIKKLEERLTSAKSDASGARMTRGQARTDLRNARNRNNANPSPRTERALRRADENFKKAKKAAQKAESELDKANKRARKLSESASKHFKNAKRFIDEEAAAKKEWEKNGVNAVEADLNKLRKALGEAEIAA
ncbi:hypothetical protein [Streptomyces laurentii]|uniref:hypothetical protein n=1 Tax=Streptomyces laurentii TaxID=39478 RepID=UPI0036C86292